MGQLEFDQDAARRIEEIYLIEDAARRRRLVREALGAAPGERILDVGCGPGFYCLELLGEVGPEGAVVGVDGSRPMLALAERRCDGYANAALHEGDATSLPVDDGAFDGAVCVQVLEYVSEVEAALGELHRALRPGGRVVIWDIDWATLSWHSEDPARMQRVLRAWDEHLTHRSLPRTLSTQLRSAGFDAIRAQGHAFATTELDPESYGGALMPFIANFATGREGVSGEEVDAWEAEQRELGERGEFYFACIQFCFVASRAR